MLGAPKDLSRLALIALRPVEQGTWFALLRVLNFDPDSTNTVAKPARPGIRDDRSIRSDRFVFRDGALTNRAYLSRSPNDIRHGGLLAGPALLLEFGPGFLETLRAIIAIILGTIENGPLIAIVLDNHFTGQRVPCFLDFNCNAKRRIIFVGTDIRQPSPAWLAKQRLPWPGQQPEQTSTYLTPFRQLRDLSEIERRLYHKSSASATYVGMQRLRAKTSLLPCRSSPIHHNKKRQLAPSLSDQEILVSCAVSCRP